MNYVEEDLAIKEICLALDLEVAWLILGLKHNLNSNKQFLVIFAAILKRCLS